MEESAMELIETEVQPRGNILNDNDNGIDYLGHYIYAEALSQKIERVSTPVTIGVFARWGSGKSFLLKHVRNLLERKQKQAEIEEVPPKDRFSSWPMRCGFRFFLFFSISAVIIISSLWAVSPHLFVSSSRFEGDVTTRNETSYNTTDKPKISASAHFWFDFSRFFALAILLLCLVFVCVVVCGNNDWWSSQFFANYRLISYVAFTKLPIESPQSSIVKEPNDDDVNLKIDVENNFEQSSSTRYIFVNFNAWEYAGSDTLWAGIVTNLSNVVEAEFGSVAVRIFRTLNLDTIPRDVITDEVNARKTTLFVNFPSCSKSTLEVKEAMMGFGVVRYCKKLKHWKNPNLKKKKTLDGSFKNWWVVDYSTCNEAHNAFKALDFEKVKVSFEDPNDDDESKPGLSSKDDVHDKYAQERKEEEKLMKSNTSMMSSNRTSHETCKDQFGNVRHNFFFHFMKYPKTTCNFPNLFWWFLILFAVITLPVITYSVAEALNLDIFRTGRAVPLIVQVLSWMPAIGAASFVMVNFAWAMLHSQRNRIHSALDGTKGNMAAQLGFMDKVKTEVKCITKLLKCAEFSHNKKYKVIISIDDLDRVALEKVKSVLEAVGILLSDASSPFVCLIAVDSRIAVKCIEETMGPVLVKNHVNGHEYLKKIINLPFCLPEISHKKKKRFIAGLITLSDETKTSKAEIIANNDVTYGRNYSPTAFGRPSEGKAQTRNETRNGALSNSKRFTKTADVIDGTRAPIRGRTVADNAGDANADSYPTTNTSSSDESISYDATPKVIDNKDFIFECRKFFYKSDMVQRHLEGNPRNIKRIFNVISLTSWILYCYDKQEKNQDFLQKNSMDERMIVYNSERMKCYGIQSKTKQLAQDLVLWVILTDQWPYRMSYLLQVIEDADHSFQESEKKECIEDTMSLFDIYTKHVLPELKAVRPKVEEDSSLLSLDVNPEIFFNFLQELKYSDNNLNKENVKFLREITLNLDQSLRQTIVYQREIAGDIIMNGSKNGSESTTDLYKDAECHCALDQLEPKDCNNLPLCKEQVNTEVVERPVEAVRLSNTPASQVILFSAPHPN